MFCSNCASEIKPDLNFCNSCGQRIAGKSEAENDPVAKTLSSSLIYIGIAAVIGGLILVSILVDKDITDGRLIALAAIYFASIFGIIYLILKRISSRSPEVQTHYASSAPDNRSLKPAETNQLETTKQPPASVTVDTTRSLEEVQLERD